MELNRKKCRVMIDDVIHQNGLIFNVDKHYKYPESNIYKPLLGLSSKKP